VGEGLWTSRLSSILLESNLLYPAYIQKFVVGKQSEFNENASGRICRYIYFVVFHQTLILKPENCHRYLSSEMSSCSRYEAAPRGVVGAAAKLKGDGFGRWVFVS